MIETSLQINGSQEEVFSFSQDYSRRLEWDPFPESYRFLDGSHVQKGLRLMVYARNGQSMEVEYVSYNPPRAAAVKMISGPWFIREFAGTWLFKKLGERQCLATFKYRVRGGPKGMAFAVTPVLEWLFRRTARRRLMALKRYVERQS